jgi:hypothetical protein
MVCHSYLAKVDFIKDDLVGVCDGVEAGCESEEGHDSKSELVVPIIRGSLLGLGLQLREVVARLVDCTIDLFLCASRWPLLGARRRRHDENSKKVKKVFVDQKQSIAHPQGR